LLHDNVLGVAFTLLGGLCDGLGLVFELRLRIFKNFLRLGQPFIELVADDLHLLV